MSGTSTKSFFVKATLVFGMLLTGSINTISKKLQNDTHAKGINGEVQSYSHAWFQTWTMFMGEMLCLIGLFFQRRELRAKYRAANRPLQNTNDLRKALVNADISDEEELDKQRLGPIIQLVFLYPTCCDILGTTLAGIGLLYVYASIWQMLRGSIIIFTGIFSRVFLKRQLHGFNWIGMGVTFCGLLSVGLSSYFGASNGDGDSKMLLGIGLILAGQVCSATQMVVEETYLKDRNFLPLHVVGMEGVFGFTIMTILVLPTVYFIPGSQPSHFSWGSYENSIDAFYMIKDSPQLLAYTLLYITSIAFYNFCGLSVTQSLTAVHRTLIDACRTIVVWGVDLLIYYTASETLGEPWTKYSFIQVGGFVLLVLGTLIYNKVLRLPGLYYPDATPVLPRQQDHAGSKYRIISGPSSEDQY